MLTWCKRDRQPSGSSPPAPAPDSPPNKKLNVIGDAAPHPVPSPVPDQALQRLISRTVPRDELAPLIEEIFSRGNATEMVGRLRECDAQNFVDAIDEVRYRTLSPRGTDLLISISTSYVLFIRPWAASTSRPVSKENA